MQTGTSKHLLLTGAGGYVGSLLTSILLTRGYRITAIDTFYFGQQVLDHVAKHQSLRIIRSDIRNITKGLLRNIDAVIHLAALSNDPSCELDPHLTSSINRDTVVFLAHLSKEQGVERFLFASSCSVYGVSDERLLTESSELRPVSLYARAKAEAEEALIQMANDSFHPVILRKATLYSLSFRMRFDLVANLMILHAMTKGCIYVTGGGQQWRPFLHVRDAALAYHVCLEAPAENVSGKIFNVVSQNFQMYQLALLISQELGNVIVHLQDDTVDQRSYSVSGQHFEAELGFKPQYKIEDGIYEIRNAIRNGELGDLNNPCYNTLETLRRVLIQHD